MQGVLTALTLKGVGWRALAAAQVAVGAELDLVALAARADSQVERLLAVHGAVAARGLA